MQIYVHCDVRHVAAFTPHNYWHFPSSGKLQFGRAICAHCIPSKVRAEKINILSGPFCSFQRALGAALTCLKLLRTFYKLLMRLILYIRMCSESGARLRAESMQLQTAQGQISLPKKKRKRCSTLDMYGFMCSANCKLPLLLFKS